MRAVTFIVEAFAYAVFMAAIFGGTFIAYSLGLS